VVKQIFLNGIIMVIKIWPNGILISPNGITMLTMVIKIPKDVIRNVTMVIQILTIRIIT